MSDKFSLYQTDGLLGIIENASNEKQTSIKSYFGSDLIIKRLNEQAEQIDQLKQQLTEKDKEISRLKERLSVFDNFKDNYGYTNYDDSEILEDLQSRAFQAEDDTQVVDELLQFFNIFDEYELVDKVKEPQIQLAIQELEKVKARIEKRNNGTQNANYSIQYKDGYSGCCADIEEQINNQIKELKGEKDVED